MDSPGEDLSIGARINQVGIRPRFLIFCLMIDSSRTVRTSYNILHNITFLSLQRVLLFISKTRQLVSATRRCGTCIPHSVPLSTQSVIIVNCDIGCHGKVKYRTRVFA